MNTILQNINWGLVISLIALLFTIFSFWWMNWRKGTIIICKPPYYFVHGSVNEALVIRLATVFNNTGPTPIIIRNLQLCIDGNLKEPLSFTATLQGILKNEGREYNTPFVLLGKEARLIICEFQRSPGNLILESKNYPIVINGLIDNSKKWKCLLKTCLDIYSEDLATNNNIFSGHENIN